MENWTEDIERKYVTYATHQEITYSDFKLFKPAKINPDNSEISFWERFLSTTKNNSKILKFIITGNKELILQLPEWAK